MQRSLELIVGFRDSATKIISNNNADTQFVNVLCSKQFNRHPSDLSQIAGVTLTAIIFVYFLRKDKTCLNHRHFVIRALTAYTMCFGIQSITRASASKTTSVNNNQKNNGKCIFFTLSYMQNLPLFFLFVFDLSSGSTHSFLSFPIPYHIVFYFPFAATTFNARIKNILMFEFAHCHCITTTAILASAYSFNALTMFSISFCISCF